MGHTQNDHALISSVFLALAVGEKSHLVCLCDNGILIISMWSKVSACKEGFQIFGLSDDLYSKCSCINLFTMFPAHAVEERSHQVCLHAILFFVVWSTVIYNETESRCSAINLLAIFLAFTTGGRSHLEFMLLFDDASP